MKSVFFTLLALFFTFQSGAQNKITPSVNLAEQTWTVDSISGSGAPPEVAEKLRREIGSLSITFLENGRALIRAENEMVLMNYDVSNGSKGTYLNFSGMLMLYLQVIEHKENTLILGFQYPKMVNADLMKFHLSRVAYSLVDSLQLSVDGNYVLDEYMYSSAYYENGNRIPLSGTTHMRLFEDGKMICNFGILDSGTWVIDAQKLELSLQGKQTHYRFSVESYLAKMIRIRRIDGAKDTTYSLYKSPFANFDDEEEYGIVETVEAPVYEEEMADQATPLDTMPLDYGMEEYVPEKTQSDMLCASWVGYVTITNYETGEEFLEEVDIRIIFHQDGSVDYIKGKKKTKGSWKLMERSQTLVLTWNKKEEVAQYWWDYYYFDESYDTKTSLNIVFTPPGEKKAVTVEFRQPGSE